MNDKEKRSLEELLVLGYHDTGTIERIMYFWEKTTAKAAAKANPTPVVNLMDMVNDKKLTVDKVSSPLSKTDLSVIELNNTFHGDNLFTFIAMSRNGKSGYELNNVSFKFSLALEAIRRVIVLTAIAADNDSPPVRAGDDQANTRPVGLAALSPPADGTLISLNEAELLCSVIGALIYTLNLGSNNPIGRLAETWKPTGLSRPDGNPELERATLDDWTQVRLWADDFIGRD